MTDTASQALAEIAGKLSEAQRAWLLAAEPTIERVEKTPSEEWWDVPGALYVEIDGEDYWLASRSMTSPEGCTTFTSGWEQLTPLGISLRTYLMSNSGKDT